MKNPIFSSIAVLLLSGPTAFAQQADDPQQFLQFIKAQAAELRAKDLPPKTRAEWEARREDLAATCKRPGARFPPGRVRWSRKFSA